MSRPRQQNFFVIFNVLSCALYDVRLGQRFGEMFKLGRLSRLISQSVLHVNYLRQGERSEHWLR